MRKIKLSFKNTKEVLSRDELKGIVGGFSSGGGSGDPCVRPCGVDGRGLGDPCVTRDCKSGTCGYYMGIYGCKP